MVEYAVLLAQSSSNIISMTANDVLAWTSRLNWVGIGIGALGLISFRMAFRAFTGR